MSTNTRRGSNLGAGGGTGRGFTLIEMLVVIAIIVVLVIIAVPAFSAMLRSNARVQALESLKASIVLARDMALRGGPGQDAAVLFTFDPGEPIKAVACVRVGILEDRRKRNTGSSTTITRSVFVPLSDVPAVELPAGYAVRGWIATGVINRNDGFYFDLLNTLPRYLENEAAWVFPETGFYKRLYEDTATSLAGADDGGDRCSFMVRFEGGTGLLMGSSSEAAIFVLPRPSASGRGTASSAVSPWTYATGSGRPDNRLDQTDNVARMVQRILSPGNMTQDERLRLIGRFDQNVRSSDTVLARPVTQLALNEEGLLANALGVRLDATTNSLYRIFPALITNPRTPSGLINPVFVPVPPGGFGSYGMNMARAINAWIQGDTNLDGVYDNGDASKADTTDRPEARIFTINRYLGTLNEVPLRRPETN